MAVATHRVEVVPVILEPHPNADSLSIVHVYNWQVVTKTADWAGIELAAYIQPDSIVDVTRPEFSWLKRTPEDEKPHRVRVIRLRKALSQGLLIPAPEGSKIGDDVAEQLGVRHYEPPTQEQLDSIRGPSNSAEAYTGPQVWVPEYDIESMYRYASAFVPGEMVYVSEKIHGQNAKFMWDGVRMWAGTRKDWVKPDTGSPWATLAGHPWIEDFCRYHPLRVLFGEIYGWVQVLRYGAMPSEYFFRAFDVLDGQTYWDALKFQSMFLPDWRVPDLGVMPFDFAALQALAEGNTTLQVVGNTNKPGKGGKPIPNIREGIVVRPLKERTHFDIPDGRVILKLVSNNYLETVKEPE